MTDASPFEEANEVDDPSPENDEGTSPSPEEDDDQPFEADGEEPEA